MGAGGSREGPQHRLGDRRCAERAVGRVLGRIGRLDKEGLQTVVQRLARERSFLETLFNTIEDGVLVVRGFAVMGGIEVRNSKKGDRDPGVRVRRGPASVEVKTPGGKTVSIGVTYPKRDDDQPRPVS